MASHWRIRHKLLLGLGLTVAVLALLVGGTLRGLWSYYLTLNSIRSLLTELKAAQEFKEAVADVLSRAEDPNDLLKKAREGRNRRREAPAPPQSAPTTGWTPAPFAASPNAIAA